MAIGIIAEYNPFHNGHIFQLNEARKRFPNEKIIIIMSGKYVQRGEIAVASFEDRRKMALKYGASEVVELDFEYATQAAHIFAEGAVQLAKKLGVTTLFFGSESNDPQNLLSIAKKIKENEQEYNLLLKANLKNGSSFPKSSALALEKLMGHSITLPNDILGLEYCKAIVKNDFQINVETIKRTIGFHSEVPNQEFASASYIRNLIYSKKDISKYSPMIIGSFEKIEDHYAKFQEIVINSTPEELREIKLVSEGMENLFKKNIGAPNYETFVSLTNSRRYTSSRIKRVMLYVLLNIKK